MKFIDSDFNKETGLSYVIIEHMKKQFTGYAHCHPEEKYPSEYVGCALAEKRAAIKAFKYERTILKKEADAVIKFIKSCECCKDFDKEEKSVKRMYRMLNKKIDKINNLTDMINTLTNSIGEDEFKRAAVIRALERNKQKRKIQIQ